MSSAAEVRVCEKGEQCTQHRALGQPAQLSRSSKDTICGACRERERDAQVGIAERRDPNRGGASQDKDVTIAGEPSVINESQDSGDSDTAELPKPSESLPGEVVMSVKVYEREGWAPEEWRRLCVQHGEDPDSEVIHVWENTEAVKTSPNSTTSCGRPGVAISGYALVCEECWGRIRAGESPRVCEPWDDDPTPPEERYGRLLRAARVLFGAGVKAEEVIVPTLMWAAKSCELRLLGKITGRFASAGEGSEEWIKLKERFAGALGAFEPVRVVDGVLVLRWVPVAVVGVLNKETGATQAITIDVRRRSVKPQDVGRIYAKYLRRKGIPHNSSQGSVGFAASNGALRLSVRPEEPWAYPMGMAPVLVRGEQLPFPPPRVVESNFKELKGSIAKGKGFVFTLSGREKGEGPKNNAIPAICAWYLGSRGKLIEEPSLRPDVAPILNRHLLKHCRKKTLVEGTWTPADTIWSTVKVVNRSILCAEHDLRDAYLALGLLF